METLLRRRFWLFDIAAIALIALCAAHAAATLAAGELYRSAAGFAWRGRPRPRIDVSPVKTIASILQRNIFSSACKVPNPSPAVDHAPRTELPLRLVAIMFATPPAGARWSVAIIHDRDSGATFPRALGSTVRHATIAAIGETRVYLDLGAGRREVLDLFAPEVRSAAAAVLPPSPPPRQMDGIRRLGEHQYEVQRTTVDGWLANLQQVVGDVRILPELRGGVADGVRLVRMGPDSPLAALGLRNGDVIAAINGLELSSPDQALNAYVKLRSASHISLALRRDEQRINLEIDIR